MKQKVDSADFHAAFFSHGRGEQFSYAAREAIFDYLEDAERDTGEEYELDVIALCCEWAEHDSAHEAASVYGWDKPAVEEGETVIDYAERLQEAAMEWLEDRTQVIALDNGGVVLVQF